LESSWSDGQLKYWHYNKSLTNYTDFTTQEQVRLRGWGGGVEAGVALRGVIRNVTFKLAPQLWTFTLGGELLLLGNWLGLGLRGGVVALIDETDSVAPNGLRVVMDDKSAAAAGRLHLLLRIPSEVPLSGGLLIGAEGYAREAFGVSGRVFLGFFAEWDGSWRW
jgi:hypothetical protein